MKLQANLIRPGNIIEHNGRQWGVLKIQIITPGKGGAFIQVEMRDLKSGSKTNERWRTADTVEKLQVEEKDCTFLYGDEHTLTFMDAESFEQFTLPREVVGEPAASSYKPAVLENGVRTMVPPFVEAGSRIVVNTADASYVERAKD